ncbi:MAG: hydroxymethylbilane synthase [Sedimentisphaerales bacterium]|nr:hydroxymethylbilane synthase [Sedimentisphaerales bacterium]
MKKTLIVATRGGALAEVQTGIVISYLQKIHPDIEIRVKKIASEGDKDRRTTLWELKETGFFTSLLEDALIAGQADAAVHSFKDLPTAIRKGLTIGAVLNRKFPEDCLVSAAPIKTIDELPKGAKVGTSSLRRTVQLKRLREDLQCVPIRGNVDTRLRKLQQADSASADKFDAIVLARAGLERLGLADKISIVFDPGEFIPSPAQGALAVEIRADDSETRELISKLDEKETRVETTAERLVFAALGCGCHAPAGVFARIQNDAITISAFNCDPDGKNYARAAVTGPVSNAETLALSLAEKIRSGH